MGNSIFDPAWVYKPPGPVAKRFMMSNARVRGIRGPWGSGKSTVCVIELLRRAQMQRPGPDGIRRTRWAVIRNTYPELKMTTIKTWHDWVPKDLGQWVDMGPPRHFIKFGDIEMEVYFIALDNPNDVKKLFSLELTGAWINEAKFNDKYLLTNLIGRDGRYPSKRDGGASWYGIIMDTNSMDMDHWWYHYAEEETPEDWEFFSQPSGFSPEAENIQNHNDPDYYRKSAQGKDPDWVKVYLANEYGYVREGKPVWQSYSDNLHCQPCEPTRGIPLTIGIDFGLTPAAVFTQRDLLGRWKGLSELVATDMGAVRFGELLGSEMRGRYAGYEFEVNGDPAGDNRAQTDETTPMMILRAAGIPVKPAPTNDPIQRVEAVSVALNRLIDGKPGFMLDPSCKILRKAMIGAYQYRRIQVGGTERYTDKPDKNQYSHVADALQYALIGAGEGRALIKQPERYINRPTRSVNLYDPHGRWQ